jgi:ribosomal protein S6
MKKIIAILFIILFAIIGIFTIKNRKIIRPNSDYIATIYHSEMHAIDAGWQYVYYIYPDKKESYLYIKSESTITIDGASEECDVDSGKIKNKNDFTKLAKEIEKDKKEKAQHFFHYTYINGNEIKNFDSIDKLADCLFPN